MHILLPIVVIMQAMIVAIGAYQDYLILGTSSYMQLFHEYDFFILRDKNQV
jgi:hypothetical protein